MDRAEAYEILRKSMLNLHNRRGEGTLSDLEAEVINSACLALLKKRNEIVQNARNVEDALTGALNHRKINNALTRADTD